ncbi:DUF4038 domain-containing protein [Cohnella ginsengisoli]|uniref:DUF4038 domain-containing protein n=1 Tax=Cohnella ginsengisoli TaxID=425004 RepID=A0A9X4QMW8_9BACL|nr:DUF4038 domain-containing protein [Cohnella ginsengisoli]MDG0791405.1 DUF4038 domain-containing protein [Cohnella ginsengisoli]
MDYEKEIRAVVQARVGKMMELCASAEKAFSNPFWDCAVTAVFRHAATGETLRIEGFHDGIDEAGKQVWKVRWMPAQAGAWICELAARPAAPGLSLAVPIEVAEAEGAVRGFLRTVPERSWSFRYDSGEPMFLLGDTIYNLFGGHYCGVELAPILDRRQAQGVNYIRARAQVSPYHPKLRNVWQTRDCWPWGGSAQWPDFKELNTDYFKAVDEVMEMLAEREMGVELVLEAWMLEFPFNDRGKFLPEHEELWIRYLVARYAAYPSLYIWCPANEYDFYPGTAEYHPEADRWFRRLARLIKEADPYKHPVGVHQWSHKLPLHERFGDCEELDVYLIQTDWFKEFEVRGSMSPMCLWMERQLRFHAPTKAKAALCSEFGYEKAEGCFTLEGHQLFDHHHTRRGQWRAGFSGYPVVHGFDNTWGAYLTVETDAVGAAYLPIYRRFMTEDVNFDAMVPAPELLIEVQGTEEEGTAPLCVADDALGVVAVYFPAAGGCKLALPDGGEAAYAYAYAWLNPRSGERLPAEPSCGGGGVGGTRFETPPPAPGDSAADSNWVLYTKRQGWAGAVSNRTF